MDDIVHFMLRLEIDASSVEILQDDTAHCRGGLGRKIESLVRDLLRRDGRLRCQAVVARKNKDQRIRTHAPKAQVSHGLFRSHESRIEPAPHQGLGEHWRVVTRQADFDARKFVAKDAVHLGQQANFSPRQKAKGECRSRRLSGAQRCFFCRLRLKQRHACMFQKSLAGRRQFNAVSAASHQLNADFLFEIPDLPAERWLGSVELLLGGNGQAACISHGDEVAEMPELHHNLPCLVSMGPAYKVFFRPTSGYYSKKHCTRGLLGRQSVSQPRRCPLVCWARSKGLRPARYRYWSVRMCKGIRASLLFLVVMTGGAAAQSPSNQPRASAMEADVAKVREALLGNWESVAPEVGPSKNLD